MEDMGAVKKRKWEMESGKEQFNGKSFALRKGKNFGVFLFFLPRVG